MSVTARFFSGEADVAAIERIIAAATGDTTRRGYWHIGDFLWIFYRYGAPPGDPRQDLRLWQDDDGAPVGFAWLAAPDAIELQIHPRRSGDERVAIEGAMLDWAEERWRELARGDVAVGPLAATAFEDDNERIALLERRGYARHGFRGDPANSLLHLQRDPRAPIDERVPATGTTARAVVGEADLAGRVALHRAVWQGSKLTVEGYRRMRAVPGYDKDLDLVAVTPDGEFGAYCICWLDAVNGVGAFEPVGTHPLFRRRGMAQAVVLEGLRRLRDRGATRVIVLTTETNGAAVALYESAGFRIVAKQYDYILAFT